VLTVAKAQKGVLVSVPLGLAVHAFTWMEELALVGVALAVLLPVALLSTYRLAATLRLAAPVLYSAAMLFPCLSLLVLFLLSDEASKALRAHGFRVGLLGADTSAIQERIGGGGTGGDSEAAAR
jgi:hypothetical protein